jgi:signal transduction histidine kinase
VRLPEIVRASTFRSALAIFGAFAVCTLLIFGIVLRQTSAYVTANIDQLVDDVANAVSAATSVQTAQRLEDYLRAEPRRVHVGGLFDSVGNRLVGNIETLPADLQVGVGAKTLLITRIDETGRRAQTVRAIAQRVADGETLIVGRDVDVVSEIAEITRHVVILGLSAALGLGLITGAWLSIRAQGRIEAVNRKIQRIVAGEWRERLPAQVNNDPFDRLAVLVNGMLDEIETLIQDLASVGDDIAHDLRTPLTRVRIGLERARANASSVAELQSAVDHAIAGIDHAISIVTALLRIREIEQTRRLVGFDNVKMAELLREVCDLYEPFAEEKRLTLSMKIDSEPTVRGDRDLLFEAVANLVDNAVKFTPEGGRIELRLIRNGEGAILRVSDTGPGVTESERELIVRRFYRSDRSRGTKGLGLGLSLVAAIVKLHGFHFSILPGAGFVAEISFQQTAA